MNLKIGGNNVGKIMYGGQEFGGATKLEPGTILYLSETSTKVLKNQHLLSTTKNWSNLNGINVGVYGDPSFKNYVNVDIPSDDFKTLNIKKEFDGSYGNSDLMNISTSIVDGEYRLNINTNISYYFIMVKAI